MDVSTAVAQRSSIREFRSDPVSNDTIAELLTKAARSPSGGNLQPWRIWVVNEKSMTDFRAFIAAHPPHAAPEYDVYPASLWEPYRSYRFRVGEMMYDKLDIGREDKAGRLQQFARNLDFFGAPAALFCFIDRGMGYPQWSDLGMFLQTFMLLAEEAGLSTCAQEAWSVAHQQVQQFTEAPAELMLFCGMAIGYRDPDAPVNALISERMPLSEFATFL